MGLVAALVYKYIEKKDWKDSAFAGLHIWGLAFVFSLFLALVLPTQLILSTNRAILIFITVFVASYVVTKGYYTKKYVVKNPLKTSLIISVLYTILKMALISFFAVGGII